MTIEASFATSSGNCRVVLLRLVDMIDRRSMADFTRERAMVGSGHNGCLLIVTLGADDATRVVGRRSGNRIDRVSAIMTQFAKRVRNEALSHDENSRADNDKKDQQPHYLVWKFPKTQLVSNRSWCRIGFTGPSRNLSGASRSSRPPSMGQQENF